MIPVETPWHYTTPLDALDHWQTLVAGGLALAAAVIAVWVTQRQIVATREQTAMTELLERERVANQSVSRDACNGYGALSGRGGRG